MRNNNCLLAQSRPCKTGLCHWRRVWYYYYFCFSWSSRPFGL